MALSRWHLSACSSWIVYSLVVAQASLEEPILPGESFPPPPASKSQQCCRHCQCGCQIQELSTPQLFVILQMCEFNFWRILKGGRYGGILFECVFFLKATRCHLARLLYQYFIVSLKFEFHTFQSKICQSKFQMFLQFKRQARYSTCLKHV